MPHFDLAIIGSGSGNSLITPELAGWQIAMIESGTFGGTCLNVGCIPTKMYVYAADIAEAIRGSSRYGIDGRVENVRWADIRDRVFNRIDAISAGGREYRAYGSGITLYEAEASFTGPKSLRLSSGEELTADRIVVASGARPSIPPVIAESGIRYSTSNDIMRLDELPRRLVILGGGFISAEFAHVFSALGVEVTIVCHSSPCSGIWTTTSPNASPIWLNAGGTSTSTSMSGPLTTARTGSASTSATGPGSRATYCSWRPGGCRTPIGSTSPRPASS